MPGENMNNDAGFSTVKNTVLNTYLELGSIALEKRKFSIAHRLYSAVLKEPKLKAQKQKMLETLLINMARTHEGLRQYYKAKLFYIRALAHHKRASDGIDTTTAQILLALARVATHQRLFLQATEFITEARAVLRQLNNNVYPEFLAELEEIRDMFLKRNRLTELKIIDSVINYIMSAKPP